MLINKISSQLNEESFWQYACEVYQAEGVQSACLTCQNEAGFNVNLILMLLWLEQHKIALPANTVETLHNKVDVFSTEFTQKIRAFRQQVKGSAAIPQAEQLQIKKQLLDTELSFEKLEQKLLLDELVAATKQITQHDDLALYKPLQQYFINRCNTQGKQGCYTHYQTLLDAASE